MVILNPQTSILKVWIVVCFGKDSLFKSILADCEGYQNKYCIFNQVQGFKIRKKVDFDLTLLAQYQ